MEKKSTPRIKIIKDLPGKEMGVKKKLKLTSLLGLSLLIMTACATNGVTRILQPNRLILE